MKVFSDPTESFFDVLTRHHAPPPPLEATVNIFSKFLTGEVLTVDKRKEGEEISRLDHAMMQIVAKTEEYKKELVAKRKQLEEVNAALASGGE